MQFISCKDYAAIKKKELKAKVKKFKRTPKLVVVQVDHDKASDSYVKWKKSDAAEIEILFEHLEINSEEYSHEDLVEELIKLNADENVDGIIVQLPIPKKYNVEELQKCISPDKDVDGFRRDSYFVPCTAKGIDDWLVYNNYDFKGKDAVVIGRSPVVGLPMTNILIKRGCTVTCCNSNTSTFSLLNHLRRAHLVISAVGKPKFLDYSDFLSINESKLEVAVDVGINRDENGKLCGDIDPNNFEVELPNAYLTPVPGGVGLLTRVRLMQNVIEAYELHTKG